MRSIHYHVTTSGRYTFYLNGKRIGRAVADNVEDAAKACDIRHAEFIRLEPEAYNGPTETVIDTRRELSRREQARHGCWEWRHNRRVGWYQVFVEHALVDVVPVLDERESGTVQSNPELCTVGYERMACVPHTVRATEVRATPRWAGMM